MQSKKKEDLISKINILMSVLGCLTAKLDNEMYLKSTPIVLEGIQSEINKTKCKLKELTIEFINLSKEEKIKTCDTYKTDFSNMFKSCSSVNFPLRKPVYDNKFMCWFPEEFNINPNDFESIKYKDGSCNVLEFSMLQFEDNIENIIKIENYSHKKKFNIELDILDSTNKVLCRHIFKGCTFVDRMNHDEYCKSNVKQMIYKFNILFDFNKSYANNIKGNETVN